MPAPSLFPAALQLDFTTKMSCVELFIKYQGLGMNVLYLKRDSHY